MKFLSINRVTLAAFLFISATILFSCQKEKNQDTMVPVSEEDASVYSSESMQADASYDDIQDISMTAADEEGIESAGRSAAAGRGIRIYLFAKLRLRIGQCADITVSDSLFPKTVTIDFGNGCLGLDGKLRRGKMVLHYTGPIRQSGSVLTVTLVDYQLNRAKIEGTKVITNLSANGNIRFSVQVTGGRVTLPNGRGYAYEKLKYVKQIAGGATEELADDVYQIEGSSKTTFNNGVRVVLDTKDPLVKKFACNWISEGTVKVKVNDRALSLDYGFPSNGDCDNKALLSWNNNTSQHIVLLP